MGQDPSQIRSDIEETRGRLGEAAEAIGYKSDVKARASGWMSDKKDAVTSRVSDAKDTVVGTMPDAEQAKGQARRGARLARENPMGLAVAGAAVGFLAGLAVPATRMENERFGETADQVKGAGQEAFDRGKTVAQEAGQAAIETARERGGEEGQELASSVKESAQETSPSTSRSQ